MSESEQPSSVVLVASDDPQRAATLLLHLFETCHDPLVILVAAFGPEREAVATVVTSLTSSRHEVECWTAEEGDDRWVALEAGIASRPPGATEVVVLSDDARPASSFVGALRAARFPQSFGMDEARAVPMLGAPIGIVAPVSEQARSAAQRLVLSRTDLELGIEGYAAARILAFEGLVGPLEVPDDLGLLLQVDLIEDLSDVGQGGRLFRPGLGRWTLADLVIRADAAGYRAVVAEGCYIGRASAVAARPEKPESVEDRLRFYRLHRTRTEAPKVIAAYRVRPGRIRDLHLLRGAIGRVAPLVDGFAVVLGSNPLEVASDPETQGSGMLHPIDRDLLAACDNADAETVAREFGLWVGRAAQASGGNAGGQKGVLVEVWDRPADETGERTALDVLVARLGTAMRAPNLWAIALDGDHLIEECDDGTLRRLASHPNPTVLGYDLPTLTLWDSPRLVREDVPWGDGGTAKGGPSAVRFYRVLPGRAFPRFGYGHRFYAPPCSPDAVRVAAVRLRSAGLLRPVDRTRNRLAATKGEEGMRLSALTPNRLGLHVLVYERENPEDVARWLDEVHGLVDATALVWTGAWSWVDEVDLRLAEFEVVPEGETSPEGWPADGPGPALSEVVVRYGADLVARPLNDDLAGARNAGLDTLAARGLAWALFIDPDEWLRDPVADGRAIRRMVESTRLGWLWQVANYTTDGAPSISDSIRLSSLRPEMRMSGRVHESFGDAVNAFQVAGVEPRLQYAPFVLQHRGMALGVDRTREKLDHYERLLRLELADHPRNPGAWVSLGWHLQNDGHPEMAAECLRRSVECAGNAYLPFRELGIAKLREALDLFEACVDRLSPAHQYTRQATATLAWLRENAPPPAVLAPSGRVPEPLPDFGPVSGYASGEEVS